MAEKFQIRKAERKKAKVRIGIVGASGSGKTYSALQIAFGLGGKIGLVDTEYGSGELYSALGDYDVITLEAPYEVARYRGAIRAFEEAGYDTIILDSISHAWAGEGGLLHKQGKMEDSGRYKNSFATWREITPDHNALIDEMLNSPCHIIATMRAKTEYTLDKDEKGRSVPRKIGLAPVQREGMEYEFTVVLDVSEKHYATSSKDRTGLFDGKIFVPNKATGEELLHWLESGVDVKVEKKEKQEIVAVKNAALDTFGPSQFKTAIARNDYTKNLIKSYKEASGLSELEERKALDEEKLRAMEKGSEHDQLAFGQIKKEYIIAYKEFKRAEDLNRQADNGNFDPADELRDIPDHIANLAS